MHDVAGLENHDVKRRCGITMVDEGKDKFSLHRSQRHALVRGEFDAVSLAEPGPLTTSHAALSGPNYIARRTKSSRAWITVSLPTCDHGS